MGKVKTKTKTKKSTRAKNITGKAKPKSLISLFEELKDSLI